MAEKENETTEQVKAPPAAAPLGQDDLKAVPDVKDRLSFFFSDANVRQDRFIRDLLTSSEGPTPNRVPIEALLRFNSIKSHSAKPEVLVQAVKELPDMLTLNDDDSAIGRSTPFTDDLMNAHIPKSLFLNDLPLKDGGEGNKGARQYAITVDEIKEAFSGYGEIALVKLWWRVRQGVRSAVGGAMLEFATQESCDKASAATLTSKGDETIVPTAPVTFGDDKKAIKVCPFSERNNNNERKRKEGYDKKRSRDDDKKKEEKVGKVFSLDWQPGCVIRIKGLNTECSREAILETIAKGMEITVEEVREQKIYADFSRGQTDGAIRFREPCDAIGKLMEGLTEGRLEIAGGKVEEVKLLKDDEEKKYWENFIAFKNRCIQNDKKKRGSPKKQRRN